MTTPTESYLRVHYELRPSKQVERRMLVDALHLLSLGGFPIRDYQYTGLGSIYFVDFILFHKLLGIDDMLSVEYSEQIAKRVRFNRPFDCVRLEIAPIGDVIPTLSRDKRHIIWMDYDSVLLSSHLDDIRLASSHLAPGSIILVTLDVEPPGNPTGGPKDWREYLLEQAADYAGAPLGIEDFAKSLLPRRNAEIISRALTTGLVAREGVEFFPLFHFLYADGHQMLTVGGMLTTSSEKRRVRGSRLPEAQYARLDLESEPYRIGVPRVTRKERIYLDRAMPCAEGWTPDEFELESEHVAAYREIYRFFPAYAELLL